MSLRSVIIQPHFLATAPSCLIACGGTRVLCTATVEESVPPFLKGKGVGWLTAEYAMLPASTRSRKQRDGIKKDGRGVEISRLIGRCLRQAVDFSRLGERTITIDCDVLEADGGTRTAAITGGYVALALCVRKLMAESKLFETPLIRKIAAVSVGVVDGQPVADLCYAEDSRADVDMNVVMDENGQYIEIQGTGEHAPFDHATLSTLLQMAADAIEELQGIQNAALSRPKLVLATGNLGKAREFQALLAERFEVLSLQDVGITLNVEETGATFADNAILKAEALTKLTGLPALADDSGLCVDVLSGAPGVRSARYAGEEATMEENCRLLITNLSPMQEPFPAHFACALALAHPNRETLVAEGRSEGHIVLTPRGENGFGYDPYFAGKDGRTFSELSQAEKNKVSHRARAVRMLLAALE